MKKDSIIRTIYLYIFALVGLILVIVGGVRFLDMGLKMFVFTQADQMYNYDYRVEPLPKEIVDGETQRNCPELISQADYINSSRQREASISLSLILVGLPLYWYHWSIIKRESREKGEKIKDLTESENA
ncbi:hypothetical protein KKA24_01205 [Patescibacteria group bacterium]|nr:hypothetical protein [Patescibacteria group bacterium]